MHIGNTTENHFHHLISLALYFLTRYQHICSPLVTSQKARRCRWLTMQLHVVFTADRRRHLHQRARPEKIAGIAVSPAMHAASPLRRVRWHCCCDGRTRNWPPLNRDRRNKQWIEFATGIAGDIGVRHGLRQGKERTQAGGR